MKTAVRRVLLMSALMSPGALYALGLGEIHLNSALNQPFDADIEIVSAADEDLSALRASLASSDTFVRYGLDKPGFLSDFSFRVVRGPGGQDVLKVTSPRPVTEPFVTLLVEATWPRGKLLREYTVLLDPPVFAPTPASAETPVAAATSRAPAPARTAPAAVADVEPFAASAAAPSVQPTARRPSPGTASRSIEAGSTYRVRPNDTLWKIASESHPGSKSDVNRAMVAIFQANPQAFDGNINLLRAGSALAIPSASDVSAIPASAASAEVARQYRLWREGARADSGPAAESGRLKLVTPEQGTPAASTATVQPLAPPAATDSAADLQQKVQQLEAELAEARRLLDLRSAELATLPGQPAAAEPGAAPEAVPPAGQEAAAPGPAAQAAPEAAPTPAPVPEAEPKPAAKPAAAEEAGPSLFQRLKGYWWILLGLLAAGLAFVLYKRFRGAAGRSEVDLEEALARTRTDLRARQSAAAARLREPEIVVEERRATEPSPAAVPVAPRAPAAREPETSRRPVTVEDTLSGEGPASVESSDPLAEADFHMAYGLYDQAADLVQLAAKREPGRRDLRLKLLEIFFVWGNRDRFLELAREMRASSADAQTGEWDKVLIMGKQLAPEDPLFAGTPRASDAGLDMELHATASALDMDLALGAGPEPDLDLTGRSPGVTEGASLDFVIDEPVRGTEDLSSLTATVEAPRVRAAGSEEPTQEVPLVDLGLEVGDTAALDELEGAEDMLTAKLPSTVDDTVESPRPARKEAAGEEDLLSATGLLREETAILPGIDEETVQVDLSDATGELPTIEAAQLTEGSLTAVDFPVGEASTMSEVGTKLDLARAYVDMGDPEGARSILDEVIREGNAAQKQEAERLIAALP